MLATTVGALVAKGYLAFGPAWLCMALGALAGDSIGYLLGRLGHDEWIRGPAGSRRRRGHERALRLQARFGSRLVFIGRFFWLIHPAVPLVSGIAGVPASRFYLLDVPAVALWSLLYLGIGDLGMGMWLDRELRILETLGIAIVIAGLLLISFRIERDRHGSDQA